MIPVISIASGLGAGNRGCSEGPLLLRNLLPFNAELKIVIHPEDDIQDQWHQISMMNLKLAQATYKQIKESPFTIVLGGDHSCAVGTWSGVSEALREKGEDLALVWLDAHMDSHTPETSESGNIHGMPLASLLGYGSSHLTHILSANPKLKPENIFLVGIRSYEEPERIFLEKLGVKIYFIEEVLTRGLHVIFSEILDHLSKHNLRYGVSLDTDLFDPAFLPATGTPVENGVHPDDFLKNYPLFASHPPIAFEFVEFNPSKDIYSQSLQWILKILRVVAEAIKHPSTIG